MFFSSSLNFFDCFLLLFFCFLTIFFKYFLLFYRFESKWDIRLRLVDKDFWTRWDLGFFQAIWYLKIPYPSTIFVLFFKKSFDIIFFQVFY